MMKKLLLCSVAALTLTSAIGILADEEGAAENRRKRYEQRFKRDSERSTEGQEKQEAKELTPEEVEKMQKEIGELYKLYQQLRKKTKEFEKKYGWKPNFGGGMMGPRNRQDGGTTRRPFGREGDSRNRTRDNVMPREPEQ